MNKSELIRVFAEESNISPDKSAMVVAIFFNSMKNALLDGDRVEIRGFGSFKIKSYEEYTGRNPKSGEIVHVAPKELPFFKPGKELKEFINE